MPRNTTNRTREDIDPINVRYAIDLLLVERDPSELELSLEDRRNETENEVEKARLTEALRYLDTLRDQPQSPETDLLGVIKGP